MEARNFLSLPEKDLAREFLFVLREILAKRDLYDASDNAPNTVVNASMRNVY